VTGVIIDFRHKFLPISGVGPRIRNHVRTSHNRFGATLVANGQAFSDQLIGEVDHDFGFRIRRRLAHDVAEVKPDRQLLQAVAVDARIALLKKAVD
jgi:hypothetical protein